MAEVSALEPPSFAIIWGTAPDDGTNATAGHVRQIAQIALTNELYLKERLLDGVGSINFGNGQGISLILTSSIQAQDAQFTNLSATTISGATFQFSAEQTVEKSSWQYIASSVYTGNYFDATYAPPARILYYSGASQKVPVLQTVPLNDSGVPGWVPTKSLIELIAPPLGYTLHSVVVTSIGASSGFGSGDGLATFELGRYSGSNVWTPMSSVVTDTHAADGSDWTTRLATTVLATTPNTISGAFNYGIEVTHPYGAVSPRSMGFAFKAVYKGSGVAR